jgi:hypothetical protein
MAGRVRATTSGLPWSFRSALLRPHDGDSFWMAVDLGFNARYAAELRLDGVHAPEIHPLQPGGQETLDFVNGWMESIQASSPDRDWPFWITVTPTHTFEPGMDMSFTRYVATVYQFGVSDPARSLNAAVIAFLGEHPEWPRGD